MRGIAAATAQPSPSRLRRPWLTTDGREFTSGSRPYSIVLAVVAVLAAPASASAAVETFHRFEAVATAN